MSYLTTPTPSVFHSHRRRPSSGGKESSEREYQHDQVDPEAFVSLCKMASLRPTRKSFSTEAEFQASRVFQGGEDLCRPGCACQLTHLLMLCPCTQSTRHARCLTEAHWQRRAALDICTEKHLHRNPARCPLICAGAIQIICEVLLLCRLTGSTGQQSRRLQRSACA